MLVARSVAEDPSAWTTAPAFARGRVVDDAQLGRVVRELGDRVELVATREVDANLLRALGDRLPALLVLTGEGDPTLLAELRQRSIRQGTALLGPAATLQIGAGELADGQAAPIACAAHRDELAPLCQAIGPTRLAIAPTPSWLPRWLGGPMLLAHDVVGYVPARALEIGWVDWLDWLASLGPRELRQLLVPLGVPQVELEPHAAMLEAATVAHALERLSGPTYPAPQVLALLREGIRLQLNPHAQANRDVGHDPDAARALWDQARRALPRIGELVGMQAPDPALSLRVPTAAFLAQRGLLRFRASQALLASEFEAPELPEPELLARADAVLEGASDVLSDQESKVVLRGHGIEVTRQAFANSASGAASFADKIGYPVVLKALSPELRRKRELGAVELDVANAAAVKRAYANIVSNVEERAPTVQLDGVVVAEMIEAGLDVHCGALRMQTGAGVVFVRALLDVPAEPVLAVSPLSNTDALLLAEAALSAVPLPARRRASDPDVNVLAGLLLRIDGLFRHTGERLLSIDLSPARLVDSDRQYVTLDARIVQRPHLEGR
ncbi:putative Acetyl-CoA synthetase (ADP-forming) alpha and beta chains [Enhygromyxa salina]|uniref:Putative Acetyl-CoA synthetase (ADP-forming) alpha and beta chains n=1 Tax=Enhygromyxa salina TaxID=215803 RepID=A0A0C2CPX8_9BACT|nr:putative Acetyl-CoA synthetase (ADP-forming) alpha and beta chains [Enhygromyxa salina]